VASALALASIVPGGVGSSAAGGVGSSAAGGDDGGNSSLRTSGSVAAAAESSCGAGTGAVIERCVGKTGGFALHLMNPTPFADNFTITATAQTRLSRSCVSCSLVSLAVRIALTRQAATQTEEAISARSPSPTSWAAGQLATRAAI